MILPASSPRRARTTRRRINSSRWSTGSCARWPPTTSRGSSRGRRLTRRRSYTRRTGGCRQRVDLDELELTVNDPPEELIALDEALTELAEKHPKKAKLVELRFFAGLSNREAARELDISTSTANRDWAFARAWLYRRLAQEGGPPGPSPS